MQNLHNKKYRFNSEKDLQLLQEHKIGFQTIIDTIMTVGILDLKKHHNQVKYPHQYIIYVHIDKKVYAVPCVKEGEEGFFLKTIIPDNKARDFYLNRQNI